MDYETLCTVDECLSHLADILSEARRGAPGSAKAKYQKRYGANRKRLSGRSHNWEMSDKAQAAYQDKMSANRGPERRETEYGFDQSRKDYRRDAKRNREVSGREELTRMETPKPGVPRRLKAPAAGAPRGRKNKRCARGTQRSKQTGRCVTNR